MSTVQLTNMMKYEFHTESKPNLNKFLEIVNKKVKNIQTPEKHLWQQYLKPNTTKHDSFDVIDLTLIEDDEEPNINEEINLEHLIIKNTHEYVSSLEEKLVLKDQIDDLMTLIKNDLNGTQIEEIFEMLKASLTDQDLIFYFATALINSSSGDKAIFVELYTNYFLMSLIKKEFSEKTSKLFKEFIKEFPQATCSRLSKTILDIAEDCSSLIENLNTLKIEYKQAVLRDFIYNCDKLEPRHFSIVECLIADKFELGILKKFVQLLLVSSNEYNKSKPFGKLLLHVVKNMEENIHNFEREFRTIIDNHESMWKNKVLRTFNANIESVGNFSLTMHY